MFFWVGYALLTKNCYSKTKVNWDTIVTNRIQDVELDEGFYITLKGKEVWTKNPRKKGVYFSYYRQAHNLSISAYYESSRFPTKAKTSVKLYHKAGLTREKYIICMKLKQTKNTIKTIQAWTSSCLDRQKKLQDTIIALKGRMRDILPANLPTEPKPLNKLMSLPNENIYQLLNKYNRRYEESNIELQEECRNLFPIPNMTTANTTNDHKISKRSPIRALIFIASTVFSLGTWWVSNRGSTSPSEPDNQPSDSDVTIQQMINDNTIVVSEFSKAVDFTAAIEKEIQIIRTFYLY